MKISKKAGILIFSLLGLALAMIILLHQNNDPGVNPQQELLKKLISCTVIAASCIVFAKGYDKFTTLPVELFQSRHLIWKLAKNDFKKRYAGSYMGAVWAMIQPVVTIAMYYIVFDKIMGNSINRGTGEIPYVLFLTTGLVPWFYFTEALTNGTNALLEYNYLVKKVVFKISVLPIIKIIALSMLSLPVSCWWLRLFTDIIQRCILCRFSIIVPVCLFWCWHSATQPARSWSFSGIWHRLSTLPCRLACGQPRFCGT